MVINKGEKIGFTLQLIKSDGISVEENATLTYRVFDATGTIELISEQTTVYSSTTKSYIDSLDPSISWIDQEVGSYLIVWSIANTDEPFNDTYTEDLQVNIDKDKIDKILGLVHQNIEIDETIFDTWHNMESARIRIFKDSLKTEILATYRVNCTTTGPGQFSSWEQIEE